MNINARINHIPDAATRNAFWAMQAGVNALPLDIVQGETFYVEGNAGSDAANGKTWATAFKTLTVALAASHANIAAGSRGWASRNTIYCKGDSLTEDLTKLADKTDVVGVGSCDGFGPGARLLGNHVISGAYIGCRFINMALKDDDTTGTIMTLVTAQGATQFIGCDFLTGTATVRGLLATAVTDLRVHGCRFLGSWASSFSTACLSLGAGSGNRTFITNNVFNNTHATGVGVLVDIARSGAGSWLADNKFATTAMAIDENSDTFAVVGNRIVVGTVKAAETSVDIPAALSLDNLIVGSNGAISVPSINFGAQS